MLRTRSCGTRRGRCGRHRPRVVGNLRVNLLSRRPGLFVDRGDARRQMGADGLDLGLHILRRVDVTPAVRAGLDGEVVVSGGGVAGGREAAGEDGGVHPPGPHTEADLEDQQVVLGGFDGSVKLVEHGADEAVVDLGPVAGDQLEGHAEAGADLEQDCAAVGVQAGAVVVGVEQLQLLPGRGRGRFRAPRRSGVRPDW